MIVHRPAHSRGNPKNDWINSHRTFSFPGYFDKNYMNFGHLQTLNDDRVQPYNYVPNHEHKNMEILGYVVEGSCRHTDSHGKIVDIPAGSVQRMSAGKSIWHTEGNPTDKPNRYLQLWIEPNEYNTESYHDWYQFTREDKLNKLCDITEKLPIKQDARLLAGIFTDNYEFVLNPDRRYYLYVVLGELSVNSIPLVEGDGLSFIHESLISITDPNNSEIIVFDLL
jgi:redox-sensitive bicupin YhaK (pirin superfamily)